MTPADCQLAANAFTAAYRALQAQRRGLMAMPDGTDRMIPPTESVSDLTPGAGRVEQIGLDIHGVSAISQAVSQLARLAAINGVKLGNASFFRLPINGPVSAVSAPGMLPCRAMLTGVNRDAMRIEIAVRA